MALLPGHIQYSPVFVWLFSFLVFLLTSGKCRRSITTMPCVFVRDLMSAVKLFGLRVTLTPSEKFSIFFAFFVPSQEPAFCTYQKLIEKQETKIAKQILENIGYGLGVTP